MGGRSKRIGDGGGSQRGAEEDGCVLPRKQFIICLAGNRWVEYASGHTAAAVCT